MARDMSKIQKHYIIIKILDREMLELVETWKAMDGEYRAGSLPFHGGLEALADISKEMAEKLESKFDYITENKV
jgi:hypothetical protein